MSEEIELMSLEDVDGIEELAGFGGSCRPEFILILCRDARAAHKLKQQVENAEIRVLTDFLNSIDPKDLKTHLPSGLVFKFAEQRGLILPETAGNHIQEQD